jgi:DNA repair protein RAD16
VWGPFGSDEEDEELVDLDASVGYEWTESMEPPPEVLMPLLPYQKQFLAWAMKQVCSPWAGGGGGDIYGFGVGAVGIGAVGHRKGMRE